MIQISIFDIEGLIIQPENYDDMLPCDSCKWDIKGCCNYDIPHGRYCVMGDAWKGREDKQ